MRGKKKNKQKIISRTKTGLGWNERELARQCMLKIVELSDREGYTKITVLRREDNKGERGVQTTKYIKFSDKDRLIRSLTGKYKVPSFNVVFSEVEYDKSNESE